MTSTLNHELWLAASVGSPSWVEQLLAQGANPNVPQGDAGCTAVHLACQRGDIATLRLLAETGADLERVTDHPMAWTPLLMAIFHNQAQVVEVLLEFKVDVHHSVSRLAPIIWAADRGYGHLVDRLLQAGAAASLTLEQVGVLRNSRFCSPQFLNDAGEGNHVNQSAAFMPDRVVEPERQGGQGLATTGRYG